MTSYQQFFILKSVNACKHIVMCFLSIHDNQFRVALCILLNLRSLSYIHIFIQCAFTMYIHLQKDLRSTPHVLYLQGPRNQYLWCLSGTVHNGGWSSAYRRSKVPNVNLLLYNVDFFYSGTEKLTPQVFIQGCNYGFLL